MTGLLEVWDAREPADYDRWVGVWASSPDREVSAHPGYVRLFAAPNETPLCFAFLADGGTVLSPMILRDLADLPFPTSLPEPATDVITPYGYGGPLAWGATDRDALAADYWLAHDAELARRHVVTEFARLSLFPESLLPYPSADIEVRSRNVVRTLDLAEDELWRDVDQKVRKNVNKARRSGLTVEIDEDGHRIEAFIGLYHRTMDRRDAGAGYYFGADFFEALHRDLAGYFAYAFTLAGDEIVSAELLLLSRDRIYSFLGGTDAAAFDLRPNDLLKYEVMRWARAKGKTSYVLGGGRAPDDGIFRYKLAFAPRGAVPFRTAQRILRPDLYEHLVASSGRAAVSPEESSNAPAFFPAYRA